MKRFNLSLFLISFSTALHAEELCLPNISTRESRFCSGASLVDESGLALLEKIKKSCGQSKLQERFACGRAKLQAGLGMAKLSELEFEAWYFQRCRNEPTLCAEADVDSALASLYLAREQLPTSWKQRVLRAVETSLREKRAIARKAAEKNWKSLEKELDALAAELWKIEEAKLLEWAKSKDLELYRIEASQTALPDWRPLKEATFKSIAVASRRLRKRLESSKILEGLALGKFLCSGDGRKDVVVVTHLSSKGTLIHELLHAVQRKKNPQLCQALHGQESLLKSFEQGKISKADYESQVLELQAINAIAEVEVYSAFEALSKELGPLEALNNKEMLKLYKNF